MATVSEGASKLEITELPDGLRRVQLVCPHSLPTPYKQVITSYPLELIQRIAKLKGLDWTCDEIARDECPEYVADPLIHAVEAYVTNTSGLRVLDFGCGSGSSSIALSKRFGFKEIVGIDLQESSLALGQDKAELYNLKNVRFLCSPAGDQLPPEIGSFDLVVLNAVVEHLYPEERKKLLPSLWGLVNVGGILLIRETPHRYSPFESHTTGLWGINYLPQKITHRAALRFSKGVKPNSTWPDLLRAGIRGATLTEIKSYFPGSELIHPGKAADLWYADGTSSVQRRIMKFAFKALGVTPYITAALKRG